MNYLIELGSLLLVYLVSMVAFACYKRDTSIANFTWGGGVFLVTLYTFFRLSSFLLQQIIVDNIHYIMGVAPDYLFIQALYRQRSTLCKMEAFRH